MIKLFQKLDLFLLDNWIVKNDIEVGKNPNFKVHTNNKISRPLISHHWPHFSQGLVNICLTSKQVTKDYFNLCILAKTSETPFCFVTFQAE